MGKEDLIGGALWEQYSRKVSERMNNPVHRGEIAESEAKALGARLVIVDWGAEACGDAVRLFWAVDPKSNRILDARFKSFGCGTAIASSDMMAELTIGKTVDEAVKITNIDVEKALRDDESTPAIPPQKMHCSVMAYDVIKKAAATYKGVDMASLDDQEIVCSCARVSLGTIRDVIRINDLKTVEEITQFTKAGAFCKSCVRPGGHEKRNRYLVDILRETRDEIEREKRQPLPEPGRFRSLTIVQKLKEVEKKLDSSVRPMLVADGGNIEVVDIRDADGTVDVFVRYFGACRGCAASRTGTLYVIEEQLKKEVDESIRVIIVP